MKLILYGLFLVPLVLTMKHQSVPAPGAAPDQVLLASQLELFESTPMPYAGFGSVAVFEEGVLHVTVGGEVLGHDANGLLQVSDSETISIRFTHTDGIGLGRAGELWRIMDFSTAEQLEDAEEALLFDPEPGTHNLGLKGLLHFSGDLRVSFDQGTEAWLFELSKLDSESSFAFLYRPDMRADLEAIRLATLAECNSGTCALGQCIITCNPPLLCQAGCSPTGVPICNCVSMQPPPQPPPMPWPPSTPARY